MLIDRTLPPWTLSALRTAHMGTSSLTATQGASLRGGACFLECSLRAGRLRSVPWSARHTQRTGAPVFCVDAAKRPAGPSLDGTSICSTFPLWMWLVLHTARTGLPGASASLVLVRIDGGHTLACKLTNPFCCTLRTLTPSPGRTPHMSAPSSFAAESPLSCGVPLLAGMQGFDGTRRLWC